MSRHTTARDRRKHRVVEILAPRGLARRRAALANLITRCQTICVAECCGLDAYDFSPIQIASYLTMYRGKVDYSEVEKLRSQLGALRANYGVGGASGSGVTVEEMNQIFSAEEIEGLAREMLANLDVALSLIEESETRRFRRP